jgi:hypothetical protein
LIGKNKTADIRTGNKRGGAAAFIFALLGCAFVFFECAAALRIESFADLGYNGL